MLERGQFDFSGTRHRPVFSLDAAIDMAVRTPAPARPSQANGPIPQGLRVNQEGLRRRRPRDCPRKMVRNAPILRAMMAATKSEVPELTAATMLSRMASDITT